MKKIIRKYRPRTDQECKELGIPTPLEMVQQGIWCGPETDSMYTTYDDIEIEEEV